MTDELSPEERAREIVEAAINDPMTDDEAVALVIQLHTLAMDMYKMAPPDDTDFGLMIVRATNMVPYIAEKLGVEIIREDEVHGRH